MYLENMYGNGYGNERNANKDLLFLTRNYHIYIIIWLVNRISFQYNLILIISEL